MIVNVVPEVKADFTINQKYDCVNVPEIEFVNNSVNASNYLWEFGDGAISDEILPNHSYDSGVFEISGI